MVEGGGLENRRPERVRGFESLPLRQSLRSTSISNTRWEKGLAHRVETTSSTRPLTPKSPDGTVHNDINTSNRLTKLASAVKPRCLIVRQVPARHDKADNRHGEDQQ